MADTAGPIETSEAGLHDQRSEEAQFRNLMQALPEAVIVHSGGKIVFVNPFAVQMLRAGSPEDLVGRDIISIVDPTYLPKVIERIERCHATGEPSPPEESHMVACDGSFAPIEAVAVSISWNGAPAIEVVARDISKRREAEQAAYQWQKRLELAQRAGLRIGLWDWNVSANTVVWSDETYRQLGFTSDSFSGNVQEALTRVHPEDRSRVEEAIQNVLGGATEYAVQYRVVRLDGSTRWIVAHGIIVRNASAHMLGVGIDITELKEIQLSLQESEEKYRLLLNSTAEAIFGLDAEGNCTFCNRASLRLLGYDSPEQVLGGNMHDLMHHTRGDGAAYPLDECAIYTAVCQGHPVHVADDLFWRADGTSFPVEYWSHPLYKSGVVVGAVVTFLDRTDRKRWEQSLRRSEEKYRSLFENATYGILRSVADGTLLDVNPALVAMLGYSSKQELLSRNLGRDIYENPGLRESFVNQIQSSHRLDGIEANWKRKDGSVIVIKMSAGAVCEGNAIQYHEVIAEDITERKVLEEQFRQAQKMEAIGQLAGGISHDFNNLLSVILGNAELLADASTAHARQHHADEIKQAARRAAQLTRQLLAFSSKQVVHPVLLDLNTVVTDVGKMLQRALGEDVHVVLNLAGDLGSVRVDRGQVEQILVNLATNARDAMPNGGSLTIRTENATLDLADAVRYPGVTPGRYIRISVIDTGAGMTEELRARIFEPFFTTKPRGRGTGLGLATVYGMVKQSGGYIWITSAPGAGSTFDVYLPQVDGKPAALPVGQKKITAYPSAPKTILVLEDEDALREVMCEFLSAGGYHVLQARTGEHALELARRYPGVVSLILCDVILPDMHGPDVAARLLAAHPEMRVLYISGYAEAPVAQKLVAAGSVLLQKPVSRKELLNEVHAVLHSAAGSTCQPRH
jgi:PAS domain S-box-containing protein